MPGFECRKQMGVLKMCILSREVRYLSEAVSADQVTEVTSLQLSSELGKRKMHMRQAAYDCKRKV